MASFVPADYTEQKIYNYLLDESSPARVADRISFAGQYAQTTPTVVGRVYWAMVRAGLFDAEGKPKQQTLRAAR